MPTNHLKVLQQFLKDRRRVSEAPAAVAPFVTIARETGAGSHALCDTLLRDFRAESSDLFRGWHVFDRLICDAIAQDPALSRSLDDLVRERCKSEFQDLMDSWIAGSSETYRIYRKTFQIIATLAAIGKVIIVGRAACCVTAPFKMGIHVRLVAPEAQRVDTTMKRSSVTREVARAMMQKKEKERRRLMKTFFSQDISDPLLYDVIWNTGKVEMREISASVIHLIKVRAASVGE